jgi:hypothetical protein
MIPKSINLYRVFLSNNYVHALGSEEELGRVGLPPLETVVQLRYLTTVSRDLLPIYNIYNILLSTFVFSLLLPPRRRVVMDLRRRKLKVQVFYQRVGSWRGGRGTGEGRGLYSVPGDCVERGGFFLIPTLAQTFHHPDTSHFKFSSD